ncbi:hypothetical protein [Phenylobacterium sp. J367]|nr:hypothetical protein [Phenylobacterium sp. J367]
MTKLFNLRSLRLLRLGSAKAHTNGDLEGPFVEDDLITPRQA